MGAHTVTVWDTETGQPERVSAEEAKTRFLSGRAGFTEGRIAFRSPDGGLGWVDNTPETITEALNGGLTFANRDETEADEIRSLNERNDAEFRRAAVETPGAQAVAGGIGLVRGGTFGLADVVLDSMDASDDPMLRDMARVGRAAEEEFPLTTIAGDVAGTLGTAIPAVFGGPAAESAVGARLAALGARAGLGGQLAQRALYAAGREGVLNMALAAPRQAVDLYREPELTSEHVIASLGNVAEAGLLGAVLGGTFDVGAAKLGQVFARGTASVRKTFGEGVGNWWGRTFDTELAPLAREEVSDAVANLARQVRQAGEKGVPVDKGLFGGLRREVREELLNYEARTAERTSQVARELEAADEVTEGLLQFPMSPARNQVTIRQVNSDPTGPALDTIRGALVREANSMRSAGSRIVAEPLIYDGGGTTARGKELVTLADELLEAARNVNDPGELVATLDMLKNRVGHVWRRTRNSNDATALMEEVYESARLALENPAVTGEVFAREIASFNADYSAMIRSSRAYDRTLRNRSVLRERTAPADDLLEQAPSIARRRRFDERNAEIDSSSVHRLMEGAGTDKKTTITDAITRALRDRRKMMTNIAERFDLPASEQARFVRGAEQMDAVTATVTEQIDNQVVINQIRAIDAQEAISAGRGGALVGAALGAATGAKVGGLLAGPVGFTAGVAGGVVTGAYRGGSFARQLTLQNRMGFVSAIDSMTKKAAQRFRASTFLSGLTKAAKAGVAYTTGRAPRAAAIVTSVSAYQRLTEMVREGQRDPDRVPRMAANAFADFEAQAPELASAVTRKLSLIQRNLARRMPPTANPRPGILSPGLPPRLTSPTDRMRFMRYAEVARDPTLVIDQLEDGTLTRDGVDSLKDNYPAMYRQLVRTVVSHLSGLADEGVAPAYPDRVRLSQLLGVPLDPSLQPMFVARMQGRYFADDGQGAQEQASGQLPPTRPPGNAPRSAAASASETQSLALRRTRQESN